MKLLNQMVLKLPDVSNLKSLLVLCNEGGEANFFDNITFLTSGTLLHRHSRNAATRGPSSRRSGTTSFPKFRVGAVKSNLCILLFVA